MATHFDQHFAEFGITQAQFRLLRAIQMSETASIAPSALAEHLMTERATISVMTHRLVERGLLTRLPGANRRTFSLALTEAAQELMQQLLPTALVLADNTLKGINEDDLSDLRAMLTIIERRLNAHEKSKQPD
jgi:DNA-binding MarR family transcriptional regulator